MRDLVLAASIATCLAACSSDDADVSGNYMTTITNRDNGCNFGSWTVGAVTNAAVTITQGGNRLTATVTGLPGLALDAALGDHVYTGIVSGDSVNVNLFGTRTSNTGNCTYTYNSEIHAAVTGDVLTGQIDYTAATNGNPDCAAITDCRSSQDFNGTRPP
jgi:hypothetical protein